MVKNKNFSIAILSIVLGVFFFCSCSFEQIITTLGKTGTNYLVGNANATANANNAAESCNSSIDAIYTNLGTRLFGSSSQSSDQSEGGDENNDENENENSGGLNVFQVIENAKNANEAELLDRCKDILSVVAISDEQYSDILSNVTRASFSDGGLKNFVGQLTTTTVKLEGLVKFVDETKVTVIDAMKDGLETIMQEYIHDGGDQQDEEDIMSLVVNFIDDAFNEATSLINDDLSFDVATTDLLMISMIATTAVNAIDTLNEAKNNESSEASAVLTNSGLISQVAGLVQVAGSIKRGCDLNGTECSPIISIIGNMSGFVEDLMDLAGV